ncbi:MAG: hypothetical protein KC420_19070, partial [Myxococcales bacterium]|nr:hypothetical protein [Myxococcales bacterium]
RVLILEEVADDRLADQAALARLLLVLVIEEAAAADAHIKKVILEGGPSSGLSPAMTAHLELRDRPELLEQLVIILRGLPHWKPAPEGSLTPEGAPAHTPIKEP